MKQAVGTLAGSRADFPPFLDRTETAGLPTRPRPGQRGGLRQTFPETALSQLPDLSGSHSTGHGDEKPDLRAAAVRARRAAGLSPPLGHCGNSRALQSAVEWCVLSSATFPRTLTYS